MFFFRYSRAANSVQSVVESVRNSKTYKLLWLSLLGTCKNEEDPFENEGAGVQTTFLPL